MKSTVKNRFALLTLVALVMMLMLSICVQADTAGWNKSGTVVYYNLEKLTEERTTLVKAVGLVQIAGKYYYFDKDGTLLTGWVQTEDGYRYFTPTGDPGALGVMFTGYHKIDSKIFFFNENGVVATGFTVTKKGTYFFATSGEAGTLGSAVKKKWKKYKGSKYYFGKNGKLTTNSWVGSYYVGEDGKRLTNTITPDGYIVNSKGKKTGTKQVSGMVKVNGKWMYYNRKKKLLYKNKFKTVNGKKYYFDENGYRVNGWKTISGKTYYFTDDGMQTGKVTIKSVNYYFTAKGPLLISGTENGLTTDENGVIMTSGKPKILVLAGHGQGDGGASSSLGTEYKKTREFAGLIVSYLQKSDKIEVVYYKNGSESFDMYQQNASTLSSIKSSITGQGGSKSKVLKAMKNNSNLPDLSDFTYALEIHFNATAESSKDISGNGSFKGFSYYVNSYKSKTTLETNTIKAMLKLGYAQFGNGVHKSSTLFNCRVCQEVGLDYSLMETAFIDDADDMKFYEANKKKMAEAVANAIIDYYA